MERQTTLMVMRCQRESGVEKEVSARGASIYSREGEKRPIALRKEERENERRESQNEKRESERRENYFFPRTYFLINSR